MSLITIESEIRQANKRKKQKNLLADSSFVINVLIPGLRYSRKYKDFYYKFSPRYKFFVNLAIVQEYLSYKRYRLIIKWAKQNRIVKKKRNLRKFQVKRAILARLKRKRLRQLSAYLNRHLELAYRELLQKFKYYQEAEFSFHINQVTSLMKRYLLDSSDATIANFAIRTKRIHGIITADSDFMALQRMIDVYVPKYLKRKQK